MRPLLVALLGVGFGCATPSVGQGGARFDGAPAPAVQLPAEALYAVCWPQDALAASAVTLSFLPPINSFTMMTRMASEAPPPAWQIWLTVVIGLGTVVAAIWFAAKVFKVGLLMHGKPPNFATLVRWARQA